MPAIMEQEEIAIVTGVSKSIKSVIPLKLNLEHPKLSKGTLKVTYGVQITITGDFNGKMVLNGDRTVFGLVGEIMFGMSLDEDMLSSFSGELCNMIAGGFVTNINELGMKTDISSPTIMQKNTKIVEFKRALQLPINFDNGGTMDVYLLLE